MKLPVINRTKKAGSTCIALIVFLLIFNQCKSSDPVPYAQLTTKAVEEKIDSIMKLLTLEEKVNMLCGNGLFSSPGVSRLGIEDLHYTDGPFGVREELNSKTWAPLNLTTDSATFFPTGSALAATWNIKLAHKYGVALGEETYTRGKDFILGPAVNITRTPLNGRTYEYMSEDPLLNSKLAVAYIKGVQSAGVAACVKHFAVNNQETRRGDINAKVDERALREIYLPAFKASVTEGGAYAVMSAYNKFRGDYCGENDYLLNKILKNEWRFMGVVMSDWGGTHSTVKAALNGLDIEMGTSRYFNHVLLDSVKNGLVPESIIDDKVRRILRVALFTSSKPASPANTDISTPEHNKTAYEVASQSIVLLKNTKSLLPLELSGIKNIAVIGEMAVQKNAQGGFGAGVKARYEITPLEGITKKASPTVHVTYAKGYEPKFIKDHRFMPDNQINKSLLQEAVAAATKADVAVLFVGNTREVETESTDRLSLDLPFGQDELIKAVCAANKNTIIVVVAGAPVKMHVADSAAGSILWSWFNGSQAGTALADVLFGDVNPSGKLPFTIPMELNDSPAHALGTFPGTAEAEYKEGILVGYRWFDTKNVTPEYPFGFGLSYTSFEYKNVTVAKEIYRNGDSIQVSLDVQNTGKTEGFETVQLYVAEKNAKIMKPAKELRAFAKVKVTPGSSASAVLSFAVADLSWFDESQMKWVLNPGVYQLLIGSSSKDIRKILEVTVK